jgi:hypothetical protein
MDRRESLKSLLAGTAGAGLLLAGCNPELSAETQQAIAKGTSNYGRTPKEAAHDAALNAQQYFNAHESSTLSVLTAMILPNNGIHKSAAEVGVPEFIEFMAKEVPSFQLTLRGGLAWLDHQSNTLFGAAFKDAAEENQHALVEPISYPDLDVPSSQRPIEVQFFSLVRNLTCTGYFTSEEGIKDLGYQGNQPNVWDGVPQEVLDQHGVAYDPEWIARCVDQSERNVTAEWDDDKNLIT